MRDDVGADCLKVKLPGVYGKRDTARKTFSSRLKRLANIFSIRFTIANL